MLLPLMCEGKWRLGAGETTCRGLTAMQGRDGFGAKYVTPGSKLPFLGAVSKHSAPSWNLHLLSSLCYCRLCYWVRDWP